MAVNSRVKGKMDDGMGREAANRETQNLDAVMENAGGLRLSHI